MKQLIGILRKSAKDSRVTLVTGAFFGALTNVYAVQAAVILLALMVFVFGFAFYDQRRSLKQLAISEEEIMGLLKPSQEALTAIQKSNKNHLVVGDFVEIIPHPNLNTATRAADAGWSPAEIIVELDDREFDAKELLELSGGKNEFDPPNGTKYALVSAPFVTEESPQLELVLNETNYFTVQTAKKLLREQPQLQSKFGSVVLEDNRIPSSLCLHYVIRTADDSILCMKRSGGMAYHSGLWSITGEEQVSDHEIGKQAPIEKLFKRALCEEIFQLRNSSALQDVMPFLEDDLRFIRILSIGIELPLYNPTIIGLAQLSIDVSELRKRLIERKRNLALNAGHDDEGDFFILSKYDAYKLLREGTATVTGLFSQRAEILTENLLHPTSRYRLFRVLRTTLRRSLQQGAI
ncbi:hypothetical protein [Rheinheimera sp. UJ63]|uniref:hypothetical protein n=1 Tax=Rheinheimera sp. UJ63 TaxID=2910157 RepID=UPI001F2BB801|nr:hypothetical protein [Rheinheimera sp. UJ63]MCF4008160.1 hypothetical protein [Rheinheimera sp. UJ63]